MLLVQVAQHALLVRVGIDSDGATGDWGVARALGAQLIAAMPQVAHHASRLSRSVLCHVLEQLACDQLLLQLRADQVPMSPRYHQETKVLVRAVR